MRYSGKEFFAWDIETTGLSAYNDRFLCLVTYNGEGFSVYIGDSGLERFMVELAREKNKVMLVDFNGENYNGGFDVPFTRTYTEIHDLTYTLQGTLHLDIFPLIKKYFNTKVNEKKIKAVSSMRKPDLVRLADANGLEYSTKKTTYKELEKLENPDWLEYEEVKARDKNDLQSVYQMFFDPEKKEEYISGADSLKLVTEGKFGDIVRHCKNDVERTYKIAEIVYGMVPYWDFERNVSSL